MLTCPIPSQSQLFQLSEQELPDKTLLTRISVEFRGCAHGWIGTRGWNHQLLDKCSHVEVFSHHWWTWFLIGVYEVHRSGTLFLSSCMILRCSRRSLAYRQSAWRTLFPLVSKRKSSLAQSLEVYLRFQWLLEDLAFILSPLLPSHQSLHCMVDAYRQTKGIEVLFEPSPLFSPLQSVNTFDWVLAGPKSMCLHLSQIQELHLVSSQQLSSSFELNRTLWLSGFRTETTSCRIELSWLYFLFW